MKSLFTVTVALGLLISLGVYEAASSQEPNDILKVETKSAPPVVGPYSQAIKTSGFIYTAGQIAIDPATGKLMEGDIKAQTDRVLKNLSAIIIVAGSSMQKVVKTTVYLKNMSDYAAMNEVYGGVFKNNPPARSTVQVAALPKDALVEIEVIAKE